MSKDSDRTPYEPANPQFVSSIGWMFLVGLIGFLWFGQTRPGQTQAELPGTSIPIAAPSVSTTPRVLKFTLSLSSPDDLKVRQGDYVESNQVLADRTRQQQTLQSQQTQVQLSLQKIQSRQVLEPPVPAPIPPIKALPPVSYAKEEAAISKIQSDIDLQLRKLDLLATMPPSEVPPAMREHEDRVLESLYRELEAAQALLKEAQEERQHQEYEYSLAVAQRQEQENQQRLAHSEQMQRVEEQRRDREFQIAQLEAQLQDIEGKLAELGTVRSPYSGIIRRVKWLGQSDHRLTVEITLAIGSRPDVGTLQPSGVLPGSP